MLRLALSAPLRPSLQLKSAFKNVDFAKKQFVREFSQDSRPGVTRSKLGSQSLKEKLMGPPTQNAYSMGQGAAAGAAAIGMGALCYYGLGLSKSTTIQNNSMLWPEYVRERIHSTYGYFGASVALTAASAVAVFRTPKLLQLVTRNGWMSIMGTFALMIGTGVATQSIPYSPGIGAKQLAWAAHCAIIGGVVAPLCFLGGPILTRAALYTAGIVGGLSTVAVCAPSDKFLYMGGPLAIGLGFVFASSLASMWLPPTTMLGAGLASFSLYGGLVLFSGFLLYDTQRIVRKAETYPALFTQRPFDPVNESLSIYMDTLNIFIRIATILAGGGQRRKKADFSQDSRPGVTRSKLGSQSLKEKLMGPPTQNAYSMGQGAAAGAAAIGMGALCYYGLGLSKSTTIQNNSMLWPEYVRERIHSTYGYFGASVALTAASAVAVFRTPKLLQLVTRNGWMSIMGTFALMIGSGVATQSIPYSPGIGAKQLAWAAHCAIIGGVVAPLCFLGGPILTRAALYTAGIVGGLSTVAVCAPSDKFLYMGGPLAIGLGFVFASSLASMWLPPTTMLGAGLASFSLYGGLVLFSGFLLYDTQRIVRKAETYPALFTQRPFDPVNESLSIYMDTLNIFIRIATILAGGGQRRK